MATSTIIGIPTTVTQTRSDDYIELQSTSAGSANILASNAFGRLLANNVYTITSSTATLLTINYLMSGSLPVTPTRIRLTFYTPSSTAALIQGNVVSSTISATSFQVQLFGPTGDTTHKIFWEALA